MLDLLFTSKEKWEESKQKKFYQIEHPILNKLIVDIVEEYEDGGCDSKLHSEWKNKSGKDFHFQDLFITDEDKLIYKGIPYNREFLFLNENFGWFSKDKKSAENRAIFDTKYHIKIYSEKNDVIWEPFYWTPDLPELCIRG